MFPQVALRCRQARLRAGSRGLGRQRLLPELCPRHHVRICPDGGRWGPRGLSRIARLRAGDRGRDSLRLHPGPGP
eukprot:4871394-Alexandrium_andersonii.AAC.1